MLFTKAKRAAAFADCREFAGCLTETGAGFGRLFY
jgi:hypothetical protein